MRAKRDESWRDGVWEESEFRQMLRNMDGKDKALLKLLSEEGGAMRQDSIMKALPFLGGKSGTLRVLKKHINTACKDYGKAPILAIGEGKGDHRIHQINPALGNLCQVVIDEALRFEIPKGVW